ncbi:hypothetical protein PR202_gb24327 [Eleusine coracana subsp. coracana]|uniref:Uncharacterized protein n=1 Tax=Eleusine coracana subsp. coracana TaxID=191504 RepID=A0AAV5FL62_ELECO|nr:hypothetical protein PR202_gb24327 [Eleusine coracana subsp. coracana]
MTPPVVTTTTSRSETSSRPSPAGATPRRRCCAAPCRRRPSLIDVVIALHQLRPASRELARAAPPRPPFKKEPCRAVAVEATTRVVDPATAVEVVMRTASGGSREATGQRRRSRRREEEGGGLAPVRREVARRGM